MIKHITLDEIEEDIALNKLEIIDNADEADDEPCICLSWKTDNTNDIKINNEGLYLVKDTWTISDYIFYISLDKKYILTDKQINSIGKLIAVISNALDMPIDEDHIFAIDNFDECIDLIIKTAQNILENGFNFDYVE